MFNIWRTPNWLSLEMGCHGYPKISGGEVLASVAGSLQTNATLVEAWGNMLWKSGKKLAMCM